MNTEFIFSMGDFTFQRRWGIGMQDVPWDGLEVKSIGNAKEYVVSIRLETANSMYLQEDDEGNIIPFRYIYDIDKVNVSHGMRSCMDTLEDTEKYIEVMTAALAFAKRVKTWLSEHPEWTDIAEAKKARLETYKKDQEN